MILRLCLLQYLTVLQDKSNNVFGKTVSGSTLRYSLASADLIETIGEVPWQRNQPKKRRRRKRPR